VRDRMPMLAIASVLALIFCICLIAFVSMP
jgi:hypothetical protein